MGRVISYKKDWFFSKHGHFISKDGINKEEDLLFWIFNLGDRSWITKEDLLDFAKQVCKDKNFKHNWKFYE